LTAVTEVQAGRDHVVAPDDEMAASLFYFDYLDLSHGNILADSLRDRFIQPYFSCITSSVSSGIESAKVM
jgi:hypothetical protein